MRSTSQEVVRRTREHKADQRQGRRSSLENYNRFRLTIRSQKQNTYRANPLCYSIALASQRRFSKKPQCCFRCIAQVLRKNHLNLPILLVPSRE